jgi:hypothetical protein
MISSYKGEMGDLTNPQFSMFNSHPRGKADCKRIVAMRDKIALSDQLEERLIEFAAQIIKLAGPARPEPQTTRKRAEQRVARISYTR